MGSGSEGKKMCWAEDTGEVLFGMGSRRKPLATSSPYLPMEIFT